MNHKFNITQMAEVVEVKAWQNANEHLKLGWKLLNTHTWDYGDPQARHQKTVYVLGWAANLGDVVHPEISEYLETSNR